MYRTLAVAVVLVAGGMFISSPLALTQEKGEKGEKSQKIDDKTFVKKAAQGGMAEVELGKLAVKNASSEAVKEFGERMIKDHTKANMKLKEIAAKAGFDLPKGIGREHKECCDKLAQLKGAEFDRAYMKDMVRDHKEDVEEFTNASKNLQNEDLRNFATKTLPVIQQHLRLAENVCQKVEDKNKSEK
jgi:putative membrane protein